MQPIIEFLHVTREYRLGEETLRAVDDVSFSIQEGDFVVILGPSGAGKSTVLNLLGGMDRASSGEIRIKGQNIAGYSEQQLTRYRAENVGFVFQFYNLIPTLTAWENVALTKEVIRNALDADEVLGSVGLASHRDQFPSQLSGGQQQRVAIARAICKNPTMLLCDEPTGALDSETGTIILTLLQKLSREGRKTVIIVTHNTSLAKAADKVIRIRNGKVQAVEINETPLNVSEVKE
ncbi:ABC transporter ATP-binding protein [Gorillibacterium timonense]|uniref:ABC transporter ATP-binding protein n=1 Tax=Gorillibacterium timonense TaxID=1689269 RepID=UPI00071C66F4|nr:ABC transporter ATP-binding protein [Gorillibacterium timonense]